MAEVNRHRLTWVDYARGIGIILVVLGHTLRGLRSSHIIADGPPFRFVDSWIYSFHMPLFFLLSGLFAERQVGRGTATFLQDKLATLAYPYLLWSTLQTLMQFAVAGHTNNRTNLSELAGIFMHPIMQFWFLYVLFLITLFYYCLRRFGLGPIGALAVFTAFWASQGAISFGAWWPLNAARIHGFYYALGSSFNYHERARIRAEQTPTTALVLIAAVGFGGVAASVASHRGAMLPVDAAVAICGIAASIALATLLGRARWLNFIRVLGVYSLEIYVAHTIASAGLRIALQKVMMVKDPTTHVVVGTLGGLVLPLILGLLCRRYHAEFMFRLPRRQPTQRA